MNIEEYFRSIYTYSWAWMLLSILSTFLLIRYRVTKLIIGPLLAFFFLSHFSFLQEFPKTGEQPRLSYISGAVAYGAAIGICLGLLKDFLKIRKKYLLNYVPYAVVVLLPVIVPLDRYAYFKKWSAKIPSNHALNVKLSEADQAKVFLGGFRSVNEDELLCEITDPKELRELITLIEVVNEWKPFEYFAPRPHNSITYCLCMGDLKITFLDNTKEVATVSIHHEVDLRWRDGPWFTDATLTNGRAVYDYLGRHGVTQVEEWQRPIDSTQ